MKDLGYDERGALRNKHDTEKESRALNGVEEEENGENNHRSAKVA